MEGVAAARGGERFKEGRSTLERAHGLLPSYTTFTPTDASEASTTTAVNNQTFAGCRGGTAAFIFYSGRSPARRGSATASLFDSGRSLRR